MTPSVVSVFTYLISAGVAKTVLSTAYVSVCYFIGVSIRVSADGRMPVTDFIIFPFVGIVGVICTAYVVSAGVAETVVVAIVMLKLSFIGNVVSTRLFAPVIGCV